MREEREEQRDYHYSNYIWMTKSNSNRSSENSSTQSTEKEYSIAVMTNVYQDSISCIEVNLMTEMRFLFFQNKNLIL